MGARVSSKAQILINPCRVHTRDIRRNTVLFLFGPGLCITAWKDGTGTARDCVVPRTIVGLSRSPYRWIRDETTGYVGMPRCNIYPNSKHIRAKAENSAVLFALSSSQGNFKLQEQQAVNTTSSIKTLLLPLTWKIYFYPWFTCLLTLRLNQSEHSAMCLPCSDGSWAPCFNPASFDLSRVEFLKILARWVTFSLSRVRTVEVFRVWALSVATWYLHHPSSRDHANLLWAAEERFSAVQNRFLFNPPSTNYPADEN